MMFVMIRSVQVVVGVGVVGLTVLTLKLIMDKQNKKVSYSIHCHTRSFIITFTS